MTLTIVRTFIMLTALSLPAWALSATADHNKSPWPEKPQVITVGSFSTELIGAHIPAGWKELRFHRKPALTHYTLVDDNGTVVVRAESRRSASGLFRPLTIDSRLYPIINWRWKISSVFPDEDLSRKSRDDFPARLYVMFQRDGPALTIFQKAGRKAAELIYGETLPGSSLIYVWASQAPLESIAASPYSDRARVIVVDSGDRMTGNWVEKQRNVNDDYQRAYGRAPPQIIGIAVMTDTDDTAAYTVSHYGDIVFMRNGSD